MLNNKFLPLALLALGQTVFAQQLPSAGSQIQQIPPTPIPQKTAPVIRIEPSSAPATEASDAVKITVNRLQGTGSPVYPESELLSLTGFTPGSELSLGELRAIDFVRRLLAEGRLDPQQYKSMRMHRIDGGSVLAQFGSASKSRADMGFVQQLFKLGRAQGQQWMARHRQDVGVRHTLHLTDNH